MSELHTDARTARFFDLYAQGEASAEDIDDFVGRWHESPESWIRDLALYEYLGMSRTEYEVWLCDPFALPDMLLARRSGRALSEVMQARYETMRDQNRPQDAAILCALGHWLKKHAH